MLCTGENGIYCVNMQEWKSKYLFNFYSAVFYLPILTPTEHTLVVDRF